MQTKRITSLENFIASVLIPNKVNNIILYRGQSKDYDLLPSIARHNRKIDTTNIEKKMLLDLKRRSPLLIDKDWRSDWEWMIYAQHFGLNTRLLDWTSNPLIALWFAISDSDSDSDSFVYTFHSDERRLIDLNKSESPFTNKSTRILRPSLNNARIAAQSGWFTAHKYSLDNGMFVPLNDNSNIKSNLTKLVIPGSIKKDLLVSLSIMGVNHRTIYPDITGLCKHLNRKYLKTT